MLNGLTISVYVRHDSLKYRKSILFKFFPKGPLFYITIFTSCVWTNANSRERPGTRSSPHHHFLTDLAAPQKLLRFIPLKIASIANRLLGVKGCQQRMKFLRVCAHNNALRDSRECSQGALKFTLEVKGAPRNRIPLLHQLREGITI